MTSPARILLLAASIGVLVVGGSQAAAADPVDYVDPDPADPAFVIAVDPTDGTTDFLEREFTVGAGTVASTTLTLDWEAQGVGDSCGEASSSGFADELGLSLTSPEGTTVVLHPEYSDNLYESGNAPRVQVTFDDLAAELVGSTNGGIPETGEFRPHEPLSSFASEDAAGVWTLTLVDNFDGGAQCYYGAQLTVDFGTAPELDSGALDDATVNESYSARVPVAAGDSPMTFELTSGALPPGITLDPSTGLVSGVPTAAGSYSFAITATNAYGTSTEASFTVAVTTSALAATGAEWTWVAAAAFLAVSSGLVGVLLYWRRGKTLTS